MFLSLELNLKFDVEVLNQFFVSVSDGNLSHSSNFSNFALGSALSAKNAGDVDN